MKKRLLENDVLLEEQDNFTHLEVQPHSEGTLEEGEYGRRYEELLHANGEDANYQLLRLLSNSSMDI